MSETQRYADSVLDRASKLRKIKTYLASLVHLRWVEDRFQASNGGKYYTVVIRANSKKQAAEIIGCPLNHLNRMGFREIQKDHRLGSIPVKPYVIYYHVEGTKTGFVDKWLEDWRTLETLTTPAQKL
jgi:hypothetical protein